MPKFYRPFAIILSLAAVALHAESCCADPRAARMAFVAKQNSVNYIF
jgi:hypothetical protein